MENCKYCGSTSLHKRGFIKNKQRYMCTNCGKRQCANDGREKYSIKEKSLAIILYLEGPGLRRIARILSKYFSKNFNYQTITKWIKKEALEVSNKNSESEIEILEMDELYTYVKKKKTGCVLVHLKQEMEV